MGYPHGAVPTDPGVTVQPTPIYETLSMGLFALVLWRLRDALPAGRAVRRSTSSAPGFERFLVEFARRNEHVLGVLTAAQIESLTLIPPARLAARAVRRHGTLRAEGAPAPRPALAPATA